MQHLVIFVIVVQSLSHVEFFVIPWSAAHQASLSFTISWSLHRLMSIELMMPSNHLSSVTPSLPALNIFQHEDFSSESNLCIRWPKYSSLSFSISLSSEYSGLISFSFDWLNSLMFKRLSSVFSNTTV